MIAVDRHLYDLEPIPAIGRIIVRLNEGPASDDHTVKFRNEELGTLICLFN